MEQELKTTIEELMNECHDFKEVCGYYYDIQLTKKGGGHFEARLSDFGSFIEQSAVDALSQLKSNLEKEAKKEVVRKLEAARSRLVADQAKVAQLIVKKLELLGPD